MSGLIIPKPQPICGNCEYHAPTPDLNFVECNGVPPTPCIIGGQQTIRGPEYQIELMSPRLPRVRKGCALWKQGKTPVPYAN